MEKEIKYTGHTASPSDYQCSDGELSVSMDLWPENGALRPVLKANPLLQFQAGQKVMYIHSSPSFQNVNHYIVYDSTPNVAGQYLFWVAEGSQSPNPINITGYSASDITRIDGVGNTLLVLTKVGVFYYLWKTINSVSSYVLLGNKIPDIDLQFALEGEFVSTSEERLYLNLEGTDRIPVENINSDFSAENEKRVTDAVMAKVTKFIADNSTNVGRFIFPFFVRYAVRLYDGTLTCHSAPLLMTPTNTITPLCDARRYPEGASESYITDFYVKVKGIKTKLKYMVSQGQSSQYANWKDVVTSVDIFVSAPIYTIDMNASIKKLLAFGNYTSQDSLYTGNGIFKLTNPKSTKTDMGGVYMCHNIQHLPYYTDWGDKNGFFKLTPKHLKDNGADVGQFYLLKSVNVDDLAVSLTDVQVPDDYLQSLVNRELMTDDYDSHDKLIPDYSYSYNNRINLAGLQKTLFSGFTPRTMVQVCNGYRYLTDIGGQEIVNTDDSTRTVSMRVKLQEGGKEIVVDSGTTLTLYRNQLKPAVFFYHPDTNAHEIYMRVVSGVSTVDGTNKYALQNHAFLNGAYYFQTNFSEPTETMSLPNASDDKTISLINKIYTSEVNNPFLFLAKNINSIGTGKIIAMAAAAQPLSLGQFGQFPLYAFTSDGVWAMEVSQTSGGFSAKQPISRDVLLHRDAIAQANNSVLFATDRGIMNIHGSQVECISDIIDTKSEAPFLMSSLPQAQTIVPSEGAFSFASFRQYLQSCRILYDDASQRIILYNPTVANNAMTYPYAYIYSIPMQAWGMMRSNIISGTNSYPETLVMTFDNKLVDLSARVANATPSTQVIVTRPFKLDEPNINKTIRSLITRGKFASGKVQSVLYGSRDLLNWYPVTSSTTHYMRGLAGTPYKFFRLLLKCTLADTESLYGCSVLFDNKLTDRLR